MSKVDDGGPATYSAPSELPDEADLRASLQMFGASPRLQNSLFAWGKYRTGFVTVGQVREAADKELLRVRYFGRVSLAELRRLFPSKPASMVLLHKLAGSTKEQTITRDCFAAMAMHSFLSSRDDSSSPADIAKWCYVMADALIAEKRRTEPEAGK